MLILGVANDLYSTYEGARNSAERIPQARFIGYPSGGHIMVGDFSDASHQITSFLRSRQPADRSSAG